MSFKTTLLAILVNFYFISNIFIYNTIKSSEIPKIHRAILKNKLGQISNLLAKENINIKDKIGQSPLHLAVWTNNYLAVILLLQYKADINNQDQMGRTPLHCAIYNNNLKITQLLLKNNAKTNIKDNTGKIALKIYNNILESKL